jgi:hypothetical protein
LMMVFCIQVSISIKCFLKTTVITPDLTRDITGT